MTHDAAWFDALYRRETDPWNYRASDYETRKYDDSLALLPRRHYGRALEVGCSIGVMSARIAARCTDLLALDFAPAAIDRARAQGLANARFEVAEVPRDWPEPPVGGWDLIVLSEVLYYLEARTLQRLAALVAQDLAPGGDVLIVNYTGETETAVGGAEAGERFLQALELARPLREAATLEGDAYVAVAASA